MTPYYLSTLWLHRLTGTYALSALVATPYLPGRAALLEDGLIVGVTDAEDVSIARATKSDSSMDGAAVGGTGADSSIVAPPPRDRRWNLNMWFGWMGSGGYRGIFHLGLDVCVKSRGHRGFFHMCINNIILGTIRGINIDWGWLGNEGYRGISHLRLERGAKANKG
jgi:hypothetical protein